MASSSLNFNPLQFQIPSQIKQLPQNSTRRNFIRPIKSSVSEISPATQSSPEKLQVREIPGDYGLPFIGPIKDRLDYFYNQGREEFFKSRSQKHNSTVFRTNMPPGPFIASNPNVVVLLDGKSFPVLFDVSKVEKKDLFTGTYMPSVNLTGGYRILSYLDPSEPKHAKLKQILFSLLKSSRDKILPEFHKTFTELFESLDSTLASKGVASFGDLNDQSSFNFVGRALYNKNPAETELKTKGPTLVAIWVLFNLHPVLTLGLPSFLEDILIHTFMLPPFLIKSSYNKLYKFFDENASPIIIEEAKKLGISKEETCHNLLFATCFNTYGGMKILFPSLIKWVASAGETVHLKLAEEVRTAVKKGGGTVTMGAIEQMPLLKSVVYETLRIDPPVPSQYGKAKVDFEIESHDSVFKIKKGEMIFGFQPFVTKDPKIFNDPEKFVPDRFVGEGENMLKHVFWSNGPETETPTLGNKQCAGKDFVILVGRLLLVEFFMRYDTLTVEVGKSTLGSSVNVKSLKKASF